MDITTHTERERQSPGCEGGVSKDDVILGDDDDDDGELLVAVEDEQSVRLLLLLLPALPHQGTETTPPSRYMYKLLL